MHSWYITCSHAYSYDPSSAHTNRWAMSMYIWRGGTSLAEGFLQTLQHMHTLISSQLSSVTSQFQSLQVLFDIAVPSIIILRLLRHYIISWSASTSYDHILFRSYSPIVWLRQPLSCGGWLFVILLNEARFCNCGTSCSFHQEPRWKNVDLILLR